MLLEMMMSLVILAVVILSVVPFFAFSLRANNLSEQAIVVAQLADELIQEVQLRKWDEQTPSARPGYPAYAQSAIGIDSGEDSNDKTTFDDIDDFDGWSENPPQDPVGNELTDFKNKTTD